MKKIIFIILILFNLNAFGEDIFVSSNTNYTIDENTSVTVEKIQMESNSTLINNGEIHIGNLDMSYIYKSGVQFINNGTIFCQEINMNINQWNWLPNMFNFSNSGSIVCSGDIYLKLSQRCILQLGENSIIKCNNLVIEKYGSSTLSICGTIKAEETVDILLNDGGQIEIGDIISEELILRNNAKNLTINGMAHLESISSSTWGNSNITIDGAMIIGDIDEHSNLKGSSSSFISLCLNPSSEKDFSLNSSGTVCYRVKYSEIDSYYWEKDPAFENEISGNPVLKANSISYDECIDGKTNFLGFKAFSQEERLIYQENKENVSDGLKRLKYGRFEFYIKDGKLIYIEKED